jgi:hypothetical protein
METTDLKIRTKTPLDDRELLETCKRIISHNPLGLFTTVSAGRVPRSRWMVAVVPDSDLSRLYSLTGRHSRKLKDLSQNSSVCWVFTSPHHEDVVTLTGWGVALPSLTQVGISWFSLVEATRPYAMNALTDTEETAFAALETVVESIEIVSPRLGIYKSREVPLRQPQAAK